jgi:hypothetical protein
LKRRNELNIATFNHSLKECEKHFVNFGVLKKKLSKSGEFSSEFKAASRSKQYYEAYDIGINNLDYDYLLIDDSFFQFSFTNVQLEEPILRYAYYPNPFNTITYEQYLKINDLDIETVGDAFLHDYEQEMSEAREKEDYFLIRYDCSFREYEEGIHSFSHIHVGYKETISIPTNLLLTPHSFSLLVLKMCYYRHWRKKIESNKDCEVAYYAIKNGLQKIHKKYWRDLDKKEFAIM